MLQSLVIYSLSSLLLLYCNCNTCHAQSISCATGWGQEAVAIPDAWKNDGYCDCPLDGADEPNTNACSGSAVGGWAGLFSTNIDHGPTFACPQQPRLLLPLSRLNDGVCDCCDGADETTSPNNNNSNNNNSNKCPDICDQVLAGERAAQEKARNEFQIGYQKRQADVEAFAELVRTTRLEIGQVNQQLATVQAQLQAKEAQLDSHKEQYMQQRLQAIQTLVQLSMDDASNTSNTASNQGLAGLLQAMTNAEMVQFIHHVCQVAGELDDAIIYESTATTCVPLRLAGLDVALLWEDENWDDNGKVVLHQATTADPARLKSLANILHFNMAAAATKGSKLKWSEAPVSPRKPKKHKRRANNHGQRRRRLDDIPFDADMDDIDDDIDDDVIHHHHHHHNNNNNNDDDSDDDEDFHESTTNLYKPTSGDEGESSLQGDTAGKRQQLLHSIQSTLFSKTRVKFVQRAEQIIAAIDKELSQGVEEDEQQQQQQAEESATDANTSSGTSTTKVVDPAAYQMVRSVLSRRKDAIQRGYDYAISAMLLTSTIHKDDDDDNNNNNLVMDDESQRSFLLKALALGTLFHGKIASQSIWEILQTILPELNGNLIQYYHATEGIESQTCSTAASSSSSSICPPRPVERTLSNGQTVSLLAPFLLQAGERFCNSSNALIDVVVVNGEAKTTCAAQTASGTTMVIPTHVPEGYHGYVSPRARRSPSTITNENSNSGGNDVKEEMDDDDHVLNQVFASLYALQHTVVPSETLEQLQQEISALESQAQELHHHLQELHDKIGGGSGRDDDNDNNVFSKFGRDGELHALADTCHSMEAGKYIYELCLFGSATQKDRDGSGGGGGGTHLGQWKSSSISSGGGATTTTNGPRRVWTWHQGTKCWNGPHRSAYVYVSCGAEHRLISADEPETCRYEFQMQSYVACDDDWKLQHGF